MRRSVIPILLAIVMAGVTLAAAGAGADAAEADCASSGAKTARDVEYVDEPLSDAQRLDIYGFKAKGCEPVPVVVYVHGGGWRRGDKSQVSFKPKLFNGLGYVFVSVNYRLSAPVRDPDRPMFPDHPTDVGAAVAWVEDHIAEYGGDGEHLMLIGHSAGGHLVELVGLDPSYVEDAGGDIDAVHCVVGLDGAGHDIAANIAKGPARLRRIYINAFGDDVDVQRDASPIEHVGDRSDPPDFLIITRGLPGRVAAARDFGDTLEGSGSEVTVVEATGYTHGDVNHRLGEKGETVVTPPVREFTANCLG